MPATAHDVGIGPSHGRRSPADGTFHIARPFPCRVYIRVSTPYGFRLSRHVILDGHGHHRHADAISHRERPAGFMSSLSSRLVRAVGTGSHRAGTTFCRRSCSRSAKIGHCWSPIATTTKFSTVGEKGDVPNSPVFDRVVTLSIALPPGLASADHVRRSARKRWKRSPVRPPSSRSGIRSGRRSISSSSKRSIVESG